MSKNTVKEAEVIKESNTEPTMKETLESLRTQFKDFNEKAEYFKTMALKASGAIEVLAQIVEKEK
jgi:hypothetical protein